MEKVNIKVRSKFFDENQNISNDTESEDIKFYTEGKKEIVGDNIMLFYEESDLYDKEFCMTELLINDKQVELKRLLKDKVVQSNIIFSPGKRYKSKYLTTEGEMNIEILTKSINKKLNKEGKGNIDIDYEICFDDLLVNRSILNLEIT